MPGATATISCLPLTALTTTVLSPSSLHKRALSVRTKKRCVLEQPFAMSGGVVRQASKKVSAYGEIMAGLALGTVAGVAWRSWHVSYRHSVDEFYRGYDAAQKDKPQDIKMTKQ